MNLGSATLIVGLDGLQGLFQPHDSMIRSVEHHNHCKINSNDEIASGLPYLIYSFPAHD